jgi:hypothetical protein
MAKVRYVAPAVGVVGFFAGTMTSAAFTQGGGRPQPAVPPVVAVDFFKVPPGGGDAYLKLEREVWMPVHRDRIRRGRMRSWSLYAVQYPAGAGTEYGYVTINVYDSLAALDAVSEEDFRGVFTRVHPQSSVDLLFQRTAAARTTGKSELWRRLEHLE